VNVVSFGEKNTSVYVPASNPTRVITTVIELQLLLYKKATIPAMAMTAAAKLPTCLVSAAALPDAEAPDPELDAPVAEAPFEPVETAAPVVAVTEVTIVEVQLQSEL